MLYRLLLFLPAALFVIAAIPTENKNSPKELTTSDIASPVFDPTFMRNPRYEEILYPEPPKAPALPAPATAWQHSVVEDGPRVVSDFKDRVEEVLSEHNSDIPPELVSALILTESMGDPKAKNRSSGARGLLGLKPAVCVQLKRPRCDLFHWRTNLALGIGYLEYLQKEGFEGDELILAYGAGPGKARKLLGRSMPDTFPYVRKIRFARIYAKSFIDPPL